MVPTAFFQHKLQNIDCMLSDRKCNICRQTIDSTYTHEVKMHFANHLLIREYYCEHCKRPEKASIIEQYEHLLDTLGDTFQICAICGETLDDINDVWQHINDKHPKVDGIGRQNLVDIRPFMACSEPRNTSKLVLCHVCGTIIASRYLRKHLLDHSIGKLLLCNICSESFESKVNLDQHKLKHRECKCCGKMCKTLQAFKEHMAKIHPTHECDVCKVKFKDYNDLCLHVQTEHSVDESDGESTKATNPIETLAVVHRCEKCNVYFATKQALDAHSNNHIDNEPVELETFATDVDELQSVDSNVYTDNRNPVSSLKRKIILLKPIKFQCKQCMKSFKNESSFVQHKIEVHRKKFRCATCGLLTDNIIVHMRDHRVCFLCKIDFGSVAALKEHRRVQHDGALHSINIVIN